MKTGQQPKISVLAAALAGIALVSAAQADTYAPWLRQIGMTDAIASAANWGSGQLIAVVDTGVNAGNFAFSPGQVSKATSVCAALSFRCSNGFADDNGHGTAVASIAAGNWKFPGTWNVGGYAYAAGNRVSIAPNANIVAAKVLAGNGSGTSTDVANGIRKMADSGAGVINLSLTFGLGSDLVSAVNYAASKGAFVVWAGGNDNRALTTSLAGLTAQATSRLILAGSENTAGSAKSTFSNTPGSAALAARWIMAPGEMVAAPSGTNAIAAWSGTSMAAPVVSGSLALLQTAWPVLRTRGTTADLLLATATDLGVKGIDSSYGNGMISLGRAFQPYGTLVVLQTNGASIPVSSLTGGLVSGGALGSLTAVKSKLASYQAFDGYARNFTVDLSGLIKSPTAKAVLNPLPTNVNRGPVAIRLADGGELSLWRDAGAPQEIPAAVDLNAGVAATPASYVMLGDRAGTSLAFGHGTSLRFPYARALFGNDLAARLSDRDDAHHGLSLSDLATGGAMTTYGTRIGGVRVALGWSSTAKPAAAASIDARRQASAFRIAAARDFGDVVSASAGLGLLHETNALLGASYDATTGLGERNRSTSIDLSSLVRLDARTTLLVESSWAFAHAGSASGIFTGGSGIRARAYGVTLSKLDTFRIADQLTLSVKAPMRVTAGSVGVVLPAVDELGNPQLTVERASLVPDGRAVDYKLAYETPLSAHSRLAIQASIRRDMLNIAGNNESSIGATWSTAF